MKSKQKEMIDILKDYNTFCLIVLLISEYVLIPSDKEFSLFILIFSFFLLGIKVKDFAKSFSSFFDSVKLDNTFNRIFVCRCG